METLCDEEKLRNARHKEEINSGGGGKDGATGPFEYQPDIRQKAANDKIEEAEQMQAMILRESEPSNRISMAPSDQPPVMEFDPPSAMKGEIVSSPISI